MLLAADCSAAHCLLLIARCSIARCSLLDCSLLVARCSLLAARCSLLAARCLPRLLLTNPLFELLVRTGRPISTVSGARTLAMASTAISGCSFTSTSDAPTSPSSRCQPPHQSNLRTGAHTNVGGAKSAARVARTWLSRAAVVGRRALCSPLLTCACAQTFCRAHPSFSCTKLMVSSSPWPSPTSLALQWSCFT